MRGAIELHLGDETVSLWLLDGFEDEVHATRDTEGIIVSHEMTGNN